MVTLGERNVRRRLKKPRVELVSLPATLLTAQASVSSSEKWNNTHLESLFVRTTRDSVHYFLYQHGAWHMTESQRT